MSNTDIAYSQAFDGIDITGDEQDIAKRMYAAYPAITLNARGGDYRYFYFNVLAGAFVSGSYVRVTKATIGGEPYLFFYGTDDRRHFKKTRIKGYTTEKCFRITANGILDKIGLADCNYNFSSRPASPILGKNGVAIRIHEKARG